MRGGIRVQSRLVTGSPSCVARVFTWVNVPANLQSHPCRGYKGDVDSGRSEGEPASLGRIGRVVVRGEFGPMLAAALPECEIASLSGETHVTMRMRDEAELFGVVGRLRDLGARLVSVSVDP
jgi:hypothetical protein